MDCISAFSFLDLFSFLKYFVLIILYFHFYYAKLFRIKHAYSKKNVTCGQCCKTPGGSCDCHVKMTYVKVIKYTNEVFEGERCHLEEIYSQSHKEKKWEVIPPVSSRGSHCIAMFNGNLCAVLQTI